MDSEAGRRDESLVGTKAEYEKRFLALEARISGVLRMSDPPVARAVSAAGLDDDMERDENAQHGKREISPAEDMPKKRKSATVEDCDDEQDGASKKLRTI